MNEQVFHITLKGLVVRDDKMMFCLKKGYEDEIYLDLPGGRMKEGEDMATGFKREMKEETGVHVELERNCGMRVFENRLLHKKYKLCAVFIKTTIGAEEDVVLSEEHHGIQWLTKQEILEHGGYKSSTYLIECKKQLLAAFD